MEKVAIILDLDNTLYSWMDSFAPALTATIKYLAQTTQLPIQIIKNSFKEVYQLHKSVEVVNAVKELSIWERIQIPSNEIGELQTKAQMLFFETFKQNLHLYSDVKDVLLWAKSREYLIVAFSDARAFWVDFRLSALNIYSFFDQVYVLADENPNDYCIPHYPSCVIQYSYEHSKPSTDVFLDIMRANGLFKNQVFVVGDSKRKDILPSAKIGLSNIWARYGRKCTSSSRRLLSSITPWTMSQRVGGGNIKPQYTIDTFSEIIKIIENHMEAEECIGIWE